MLDYVRNIPTKLYFGKNQISHLNDSLKQFGKNVLLTYGGGSIKRIGLYDKIMSILHEGGFNVIELSGIEPNPKVESVEEGAKLCKENNIDVILAVGGGSTIDCSKAIAVGAFYDGDMWEMIVNQKGLAKKALPLVTILTLSATGSEYDGGGVISNLKTNEKIGRSFTYPSVSICDPTYTFSVNAYHTAAGSIDIMSHIFEEYFSRTTDCDLSDGICETILSSVIKNCPIAIKDPTNYSARANLMTNSSIACSGIPSYGMEYSGWPCHAMEHQLSAYYDITHGVGLAILTPKWMRYILKKDVSVASRIAKFARNVFSLDEEDEVSLANKGIDELEKFIKSIGIPTTLKEVGINEDKFFIMAKNASKGGRMLNSYVPLDVDDIVNIFKDCL